MTRKFKIVFLLTQGKKENCDNSQATDETVRREKLSEKLPHCYKATLKTQVGWLTFLRKVNNAKN